MLRRFFAIWYTGLIAGGGRLFEHDDVGAMPVAKCRCSGVWYVDNVCAPIVGGMFDTYVRMSFI